MRPNRILRLKPALQTQLKTAILPTKSKKVLVSQCYATSVAMRNCWRESKLKPYVIPENLKETFKGLFSEGKMTILEREAINTILSRYGKEI